MDATKTGAVFRALVDDPVTLVGGVTGAVVASQGQEHLKVPAETRLQFQLSAAMTVRP